MCPKPEYSAGKADGVQMRKMNNDDEEAKQKRPPNPWEHASVLSKLLFIWPYPLLKLGMTRPLEQLDLPDVPKVDASTTNRDYLDHIWQLELEEHPKKPSLHRAILRDFFKTLWYIQPLQGASSAAKVIQSVALGLMIESFETGRNGYIWAAVLVLCGLFLLFEHHHVFMFTWHKGMQLRTASVANIYAKSLRLSSTHQETAASSGKILNLASNDVERFLMAALFINYLIWAPIQSFAILGVGVWLLGPAFAAGFALLLIVVVPVQLYLSNRFAFYRSKIAALTDRRVNLVSQAVYGTRVMKMSGWEWQFFDRIVSIRKKEISQIERANRLKAWNEALFFSTNVVISIFIFIVHVAMGGTLNPRNVFTVMSLINVVQLEVTKHLSMGVMVSICCGDGALVLCRTHLIVYFFKGVSECYVSISRIQKFLEFPELPSVNHKLLLDEASTETAALSLQKVTSYWNEVRIQGGEKQPVSSLFLALSDVTLECTKASLTCIIGSVGSGKSALLQAIVGEIPVSSGVLKRNCNTIAYAAQDTFVMDGTVRENITMGLDWDAEWYDKVVKATGLEVDFKQFRKGDQTIVGDRGVQCSGGQRARIGLARALYRDADVLVCDDPLSAVDAKVGRQIFFEGLMGLAVNRGKCVVLATHQHQYVNEARCVLMAGGKIQCTGSYDDCVKAADGNITAHAPDSSVDNLTSSKEEAKKMDTGNEAETTIEETDVVAEEDGKEMNVTGLVSYDTFLNYSKAMGGVWVSVSGLILFSVTQASVVVTIATLGIWANRPPEDQDSWEILGLVIGLGFTVVFLAIVRAMLSFHFTIKASQRLHDRMTKAVLRAKIEFFDTNPLGRILNRFSADVGSNDDLLPHTLFDFFMSAFLCLGSLVTAVAVLPFTLIPVPLLLWYFMSVRRIFTTTARELKRLESLARSPIFAMLSESLGGISTIRSNDALAYFEKKFATAQDAHSRAFFSFIASSRWVGFRIDSIAFLFIAISSFLAVLFNQEGWFEVDSAILGLALTMMLQLMSIFQWCIRQSAEVINQMVAVERVLGFGDLPAEADLELESDKQLDNWPQNGAMTVSNLSARYRATLPLSLEKVSFEIPSGSHVGVVGRTGSGKSTLVQCLFRLLEPEEGSIQLSGVDITNVGLHTLRTRLSVIPQAPVLFSGCTIRENLDPFSRHEDGAIEEVLRDVHMWQVVQYLPNGLFSAVAEGGSNFSVGQRQLLCLARAILRKSRFLILDEPTANVDRRTDQLLQAALHKSFPDATILSVAHRLDTVIDSDYIVVLGHGHVLEFGSPVDLINKQDGHFASMVRDSGNTMAQDLRRRAGEKSTDKKVL